MSTNPFEPYPARAIRDNATILGNISTVFFVISHFVFSITVVSIHDPGNVVLTALQVACIVLSTVVAFTAAQIFDLIQSTCYELTQHMK